MSRLRELVAQWVERADEDFLTAVRLLDDHDTRFRRAIVYHAQQAAEKYLNALLARHQIKIEKSAQTRGGSLSGTGCVLDRCR
jgi:HEPN domain-containing protein